jgi:hypothetical protein
LLLFKEVEAWDIKIRIFRLNLTFIDLISGWKFLI